MADQKLNEDQRKIAIDMQRRCYTHQRIADELGVHRTTVSRSLSKYNRQVTERLLKRGVEQRARQFERLEFAIEEAITQWHRSKLDAETTKITQGGGEDGGDKTELTSKGQCGDPRYLAEIRAAMAEQRKLLGLDEAGAGKSSGARPPDDMVIPDEDPRSFDDGSPSEA